MIEVTGTAAEIKEAVKGIAPDYPADLIDHLDHGEWLFILNGVDTKVVITE